MKEFENASFKDHPVISAEYTKFIMRNSASDVTTSKISKLEEEVKALDKLTKSAEKSAINASNTADVTSKALKELETKVKSLKTK